MTQPLNILMAQMNPLVGAIEANTQKIIQIIQNYQANHDLIIFPELAICGYPPEDLLFSAEFFARIETGLEKIAMAIQDAVVIMGHPQMVDTVRFNAATVFDCSGLIGRYYKQQLPNYGVFDEQRYFSAAPVNNCIFTCKDQRIGLSICEDLWCGDTIKHLKQASIDILVTINASPFDYLKPQLREQVLRHHAQPGMTIIYVNMVGAQDELVFDGQSLVMDGNERIKARAPAFIETNQTVRIHDRRISSLIVPAPSKTAMIYQALILGLRDYVNKNHIPGVLIGLSGGIDSALTLVLAVDALGADRVKGVLLPSRYTAAMSNEDAKAQATALKVSTDTLSIEQSFEAVLGSLAQVLPGEDWGITAENIQARLRAVLLMAMSNHSGWMLVSTSNKSETAVGFTTLYGDMSGGFAVLKDVLKTMVYELADYRNSLSAVIPARVISRAPSAELAPNQSDQDRLPPYELLDAIITGVMEQGYSEDQFLQMGYDQEAVKLTLKLIRATEYKRKQAPIGSKISPRAFGKDWRKILPIR